MIPAVVNQVPFQVRKEETGEVKNVFFVNPVPILVKINNFEVVLSNACYVTENSGPIPAVVIPPITVITKVNGSPLVVVGSTVVLSTGHRGQVPPSCGAGLSVNVD